VTTELTPLTDTEKRLQLALSILRKEACIDVDGMAGNYTYCRYCGTIQVQGQKHKVDCVLYEVGN
jgi:hypothetical protein